MQIMDGARQLNCPSKTLASRADPDGISRDIARTSVLVYYLG